MYNSQLTSTGNSLDGGHGSIFRVNIHSPLKFLVEPDTYGWVNTWAAVHPLPDSQVPTLRDDSPEEKLKWW